MTEAHNFIDKSECLEYMIGGNQTDIIGAALCSWASNSVWQSTIVFGIIPIMLMAMVYVRTQKIAPSTLVGILSLLAVQGVEFYYLGGAGRLVLPIIRNAIYGVLVLGFALSMLSTTLNKEN